MTIRKHDKAITTLDDWFTLAPPKDKEKQWVDGRSAKESAKAWLQSPGAFPAEIAALLQTSGQLGALTIDRIEPEALLPFDSRNGPRNADVAVWAHDQAGSVAITVEAKADEPFDLPVTDVFAQSLERLLETSGSGGVARVVELAQSLFGARTKGLPRVGDLRYQLLTATAGTLALAESTEATRAVLVVHELVTTATSLKKLALNAADFSAFVHRVSAGSVTKAESGVLYGPFSVPAKPLFRSPIALFVGKAVAHLGAPKP